MIFIIKKILLLISWDIKFYILNYFVKLWLLSINGNSKGSGSRNYKNLERYCALSPGGQFILEKLIGRSEMYSSNSAMNNDIESVSKNAQSGVVKAKEWSNLSINAAIPP